MVVWHHWLMDMSLSKLQELVMDREICVLQSMGLQRVRHDWTTKLNWTDTHTHTCMCMLSHISRVQLFVTLRTIAHQALPLMEFSRQKYWRGLLCPPLGDRPNPGIEPMSLMAYAVASGYFANSAPRKSIYTYMHLYTHTHTHTYLQQHGWT